MPSKRVAIVTSSTRSPRLNPTITHYVYDVLASDPMIPIAKSSIETTPESRRITLDIIDLASQSLSSLRRVCYPGESARGEPDAALRQSTYTRLYNWSIPASLKNALDYLFHEWKGKAAGIVSYGSRGGGKAAEHLRGILTGLRMRVVSTAPGLPVKYTGLPVGEAEERFMVDERDLEGWKDAGVEGMMRNLGMELVCELDKTGL
ncbi:NADPH-dependent FMN reductase [Penicillium capsulatum]|nr:NADPH-dependent FMN reductase [Penicillium capsulatum]